MLPQSSALNPGTVDSTQLTLYNLAVFLIVFVPFIAHFNALVDTDQTPALFMGNLY